MIDPVETGFQNVGDAEGAVGPPLFFNLPDRGLIRKWRDFSMLDGGSWSFSA